jgi:uncharacterized protein involved in exopolysaccharide biosynthesis
MQPSHAFTPAEDDSLIGYLNCLLRHRRLVAPVPIIAVLGAMIFAFAQPRTYTSLGSFTPQSGDEGKSGLSGLAGQLGISVGAGSAAQSPAFYGDLLKSREILAKVATTKFKYTDRGRPVEGTIADLYGLREENPDLTTERVIARLREDVNVRVVHKTGIVEISATATAAPLARALVVRMIELVNEFNLKNRQSQATAERDFVQGRLADEQGALRTAEDRLQSFLDRNRQFRLDPSLNFDFERLQREVAVHQALVTSLVQSFEQAKVDAIRNTPVISVVETPNLPVRANSRGLAQMVSLAGIVGAMLAIILVGVVEATRRARASGTVHAREFVELKDASIQDLRRLVLRPSGRSTQEQLPS